MNSEGVTPQQAVTGRPPSTPGDVLSNFGGRLAEHSLISASPSAAKQVAMRETARIAMIRLHYSKSLREAELARSRTTTQVEAPTPGDLVFFWRAQKYNAKKNNSRRRLLLNRWHGPGLLVAREGADGTSTSANCFISFRGQLTKCPTEHVRKASSLESIAAGSWEAAIDEVISAARRDQQQLDDQLPSEPQQHRRHGSSSASSSSSEEELIPANGGPTPAEVVAAMQPVLGGGDSGKAVSSLPSVPTTPREEEATASGVNPGTPIPAFVRRSSQSETPPLQRTLMRARSLDGEDGRGLKRIAENQLTPEDQEEIPGPQTSVTVAPIDSSALESQPAFEALSMTWEQLCNVQGSAGSHPLLQLQAASEMDRRSPLDSAEYDHGTWDGRWAFLPERDWQTMQALGNSLPIGDCSETLAVQSA